MEETIEQRKVRVAGYMAAVARLLGGDGVSQNEFRDNVELMVGGSAVNMPTLLHWAETTRRTGRPMLHLSPTDEASVPLASLVAHVDGRTHIIESCMLWMGAQADRARLVPDNFRMGAFVFDRDLRLHHVPRAPSRKFDAALPGMKRAYGRLIDLEIEQRQRRQELPLPVLLSELAA